MTSLEVELMETWSVLQPVKLLAVVLMSSLVFFLMVTLLA